MDGRWHPLRVDDKMMNWEKKHRKGKNKTKYLLSVPQPYLKNFQFLAKHLSFGEFNFVALEKEK
jgi:hypothetical protein